MKVRQLRRALLLCMSAGLLASCRSRTGGALAGRGRNPAAAPDAALDARVRAIVAGMTLEQKIGQMTQPDIRSIKPDEVRHYYIGSILNGGGAWPGMNKHSASATGSRCPTHSTTRRWSTDMAVKVPVIWGTDAVHGHGNVYRCDAVSRTISGSARRMIRDLIERIGRRHRTSRFARPASPGCSRRRSPSCRTRAGAAPTKATQLRSRDRPQLMARR